MQANQLTLYGAFNIAGHSVCAVQPGKTTNIGLRTLRDGRRT
jgi:hypothetical protein